MMLAPQLQAFTLRAPDPRGSWKIYTDFDGTISSIDSLKFILNYFAGDTWHEIERAMAGGRLSEEVGLQQAFDFLNVSFHDALDLVMKNVKLDPSFRDFAEWALGEGHEVEILSGGFSNFIYPLLEREGLDNVPVIANTCEVINGKWRVVPASGNLRLCALCNHCKTFSLSSSMQREPQRRIIYIGDGHTDRCPVQLADCVYAKSYLASYCETQGIAYTPYQSFSDILDAMKGKALEARDPGESSIQSRAFRPS